MWLSPTCDCLSVIIKSLIFCCVSLCCRLHYKYRIYIALCIMAVLFALTVGFTPVPTQHCKILCKELNNFSNSLPPHLHTGADGFFSLTLLTVLTLNGMSVDYICYFSLKTISVNSFFISVASSMFQSSTFGFAGVFPFKYTSVVLSGQVSASASYVYVWWSGRNMIACVY